MPAEYDGLIPQLIDYPAVNLPEERLFMFEPIREQAIPDPANQLPDFDLDAVLARYAERHNVIAPIEMPLHPDAVPENPYMRIIDQHRNDFLKDPRIDEPDGLIDEHKLIFAAHQTRLNRIDREYYHLPRGFLNNNVEGDDIIEEAQIGPINPRYRDLIYQMLQAPNHHRYAAGMGMDTLIDDRPNPLINVDTTKEASPDTRPLIEQAVHVPRGWNRKRLASVIKTRVERGIDANVNDATYWLATFDCPPEVDGQQMFSTDDEVNLMVSVLYGQNSDKLPARPNRIERLFHTPGAADLYGKLLAAKKNNDEAAISEALASSVPDGMENLRAAVETCKKFGLTVQDAHQAATLANLRQMSERRQRFTTDAQNWLTSNSTAPRDLLVSAWHNRDIALQSGVDDNPTAIRTWADANFVPVTLRQMQKKGEKVGDVSVEDLKTYENYVRELSRVYDARTVIKAIGMHKKNFNPEALLPSYVTTFEDGWRVEVLDKDDPRGYTIGKDVDCCMKVDGIAESCLVAGYGDERYGFFALYDKDNRMVANSLLYINPDTDDKTIVVDNIEKTFGRDRSKILGYYIAAMPGYVDNIAEVTGREIDKVHLGIHFSETYEQPLKAVSNIDTPKTGTRTDAHTQKLIFERIEGESSSVQLVPMDPNDIVHVNAMECQVYAGLIDQPSHGYNDIDATGDPNVHSYWVRQQDVDMPVGYVVAKVEPGKQYFESTDGDVLYIDDMAILAQHRQKGIGQEVLKEMLQKGKTLGLPIVFHAKDDTSWKMLQSREDALAAAGFRLTETIELPDYYDTGTGAHLMMLSPVDQLVAV